ncbi:PH domain-containing protein [Faecalicatena contorta]|uniref:PH domain-containing protein n=1 Tax=Faecalicatena contorta TaxID=39482 RepID=UPI001F31D0AB|nr:PH domain-containing protein [Faecalicatena contorta]MCF2554918.1 PH domain-containing protein [Faecalicatena contorta]
MTFKGRVSKIWYTAIAVLNGIAIASVIYSGISKAMIFSLIVLLLVDLYLIPVLFKNEVTVDKKSVTISFGLLKKVLPVQDITLVRQMKDYSASFAADFNRVGIESRRMTTVYVSVTEPDEFIAAMMKMNKKIRHII